MNYTTATFEYHDGRAGSYVIMAVRLDKTNPMLRSSGFRDGHVVYVCLEGQCQYADYDYRRFTKKFTHEDDNELAEILRQLESDYGWDFDEVDGHSLGPEDVIVAED